MHKKKPFLSQNDLSSQIRRMVAFIEHEARERAEELDSKAEGEYCFEKGRLLHGARQELVRLYDKKEKLVLKQTQIDAARMVNEARLRQLAVREAHISGVEAAVQDRLLVRNQDLELYKDTLLKMLVQSLYRLMERSVEVRVREQDIALVEELVEPAAVRYKDAVGRNIKVKVDKTKFLPPSSLGGVELATPDHKLFVVNTFHSRLQVIVRHLVPVIRAHLFNN